MPVIAAHLLEPDQGNQQTYCGLDSALTFEINEALAELRRNDETTYHFELAMQAPALEMMLRGMRVDPVAREKAIRETRAKLDCTSGIIARLAEAIQGSYKPTLANSGTQLRELFYHSMGYRELRVSVKGESKVPMDRKVLERLEAMHYHARPIINAILLARDLSKQLQVMETEIDPDWRWRCSYNIGGTSTGRWSSSKSGTGTGNNFQNISEELRRIFIPDIGYKLYGIDLEQAEAREVGWFCGTVLGDWSYLDAAESGDLHTTVTRMVYPDWDWTGDLKKDRKIAERIFYRHFTYRDANKKLGHGSNYLGRPPSLAVQTKIPLKLVKSFQERYFEAFPCIPRMHQWVAQELQRTGFLTNSFGRRRDFFDRTDSEETLRGAVAFLFQSATGDRLNLGLYRIWRYMPGRIQILSQLHDAVYFQAKEEDEKEVIPEALERIQVWLKHGDRQFTIKGEAVGGWNWAHRFRLDAEGNSVDWNPRGLAKIKAN